ncbi:MAG TPA: peptide chain release factor N(5)-glutamine methyltransferase, partial [Halothiobacillaceae bacterium]|nr:peptide chain release factor N(5)-glutamine methyltransferase [Halothiobacillaceae bacterium]
MTLAAKQLGSEESLDALLRRGAERIADGRGCDWAEALFEARLLVAFVTGLGTAALMLQGDRSPAPGVSRRFSYLCDRRAAGEPIAYLLGERGFWRHRFRTTTGVLIPRPDTEVLVEWALELLPSQARWRVIDLGTGTGAIGLSIAAERPEAEIHAVDRSPAAVELAARNRAFLAEQGATVSMGLWRGDWLAAIASASVDLLVSNPPYLAADDGLADYRRLCAGARRVLRPGGWLLLEHGFAQAESVADRLHQ